MNECNDGPQYSLVRSARPSESGDPVIFWSFGLSAPGFPLARE